MRRCPSLSDVPAQVRDVEGLRLVVVEDAAQRRLWNTLLATEHPQGTTTFVGCQLRYLTGRPMDGWARSGSRLSQKMGRIALAKVCDLVNVDRVVTDREPRPEIRRAMEAADVELVAADRDA